MKWERQRAIWQTAYEIVPELAPLQAKSVAFISELDELSEHRNRIIHGLWGLFSPGEPLLIHLTTVKSQAGTEDGLLFGRGVMSLDWLRNFSEAANRLNLELITLTAPLIAMRGEPPPQGRRL